MKEQDQEAVERRERGIDEALKETFPASDLHLWSVLERRH
jgi:hypothetical protein